MGKNDTLIFYSGSFTLIPCRWIKFGQCPSAVIQLIKRVPINPVICSASKKTKQHHEDQEAQEIEQRQSCVEVQSWHGIICLQVNY